MTQPSVLREQDSLSPPNDRRRSDGKGTMAGAAKENRQDDRRKCTAKGDQALSCTASF